MKSANSKQRFVETEPKNKQKKNTAYTASLYEK